MILMISLKEFDINNLNLFLILEDVIFELLYD